MKLYKIAHVVIFAVCCQTALGAGTDASYQKDEKKKSNAELIRMQLKNEFLYASDNYFGANSDVVYADGVKPSQSAEKAPEQTAEATAPTSSKKDKPSSTSESQTETPTTTSSAPSTVVSTNPDTSTPGDGTTTPGDGTTTPGTVITDPPPVVDPPVIDPPPDCPT